MSNMFYRKTLKVKENNYKSIEFNDFSDNINTDLCDEGLKQMSRICYNYQTESGALETKIGFSSVALPNSDGSSIVGEIKIFNNCSINKLWHFKYFDHVYNRVMDKVMFYTEDGCLSIFDVFSIDKYSYVMDDIEPFLSLPTGINYCIQGEDFMLFSGDGGLVAYTPRRLPIVNENCPLLKSICKAYDHIFAILGGDKNKLLYTSNLNPLVLSSSNKTMDLTGEAGRLSALINFDDYLFIFREFGITKLSKYGSSDNFTISEIYQSSTKIYENTIKICGNVIVFLAQDGIYKFNGSSVEKIELNIQKLIDKIANVNASACWNRGKYILACKLDFDDNLKIGCEDYENGYKNNALIILNLKSKKFNLLRGLDISSLLSLNAGSLSTVLTTFNGKFSKKIGLIDESAKIFGNELTGFWQSGKFDFGYYEKLKIIRKIFIKTKENCEIIIKSDLEEKEFLVLSNSKTQCINTKLKGKSFEVTIKSSGKSKISSFKLKANIE